MINGLDYEIIGDIHAHKNNKWLWYTQKLIIGKLAHEHANSST